MARLLVVLVILALTFTVYALVDCIMFSRVRTRGLPKLGWICVVALFPVVGGLMWFLVGRGRKNSGRSTVFQMIGPDDDPEFLGTLHREVTTDDRIREIERQLSELDDDSDNGKTDNGRTER